jgi:1-acyl-sn-glycerol-3-phosphate acyltransferase
VRLPEPDGRPLDAGARAWRLLVVRVAGPAGRAAFAPSVTGSEHVPARGGAVLAFNHDSWFDGLLVAQVTPRPIRFMGKTTILARPGLGHLLRLLGVFPAQPDGGDGSAVGSAAEICRAGGLVGIFPEGGLTPEPRLARLRRGAARIAVDAGVPIVPIGIGGHRPLRRARHRAFVRVGEPLPPDGDVGELTLRLEDSMVRLLDGWKGAPASRPGR